MKNKIKNISGYINLLTKNTFTGLSAIINVLGFISFVISFPLNFPFWIPLIALCITMFYSSFKIWEKERDEVTKLKSKDIVKLDKTEKLMMQLMASVKPEMKLSIIETWGGGRISFSGYYDNLLYDAVVREELTDQQQVAELESLEKKGLLKLMISSHGTRSYIPTKLGHEVINDIINV